MGVVDDHRVGLPGVHRLEPTGQRHDLGEAVGHSGGEHPELAGGGGGRQRVRHVEHTPDPQPYLPALPDEGAAVGGDVELACVVERERVSRHPRRVEQQATVAIVGVDDGALCQRRVEEPRLRREVALDRPVKVEVILTEVREHRDREARRVDARQFERMRRHLHGDRGHPVGAKTGQASLQIGRLGRGAHTGQRADDAGATTAGLEDRGQEVHRGRLAVGPGDTDDGEIT